MSTGVIDDAPDAPDAPRRAYDNTHRLELAAETRDRIVEAGVELRKAGPLRDWQGLTVRAVAEAAGVNERTIYRHFKNERGLRDAVMHRIEQEAGIDLDAMELGNVAELTRRTLTHVATFPTAPRPKLDPTLSEASRRLHEALVAAVAKHNPGSSAAQQTAAAALLDVLWSPAAFERLVGDWGFESDRAIHSLTWAVETFADAIGKGHLPGEEMSLLPE
jgi:AcrR family transcriptional regulator